MLRRIEDGELRQLLGEILSSTREGEQAEYERYVRTIDSPPFSPSVVQFGHDSDGDVVVTAVDWETASEDPAFRLRILQGMQTYKNLLKTHKAILLIHERALQILADQGYSPKQNWLEDNRDRFDEELGE
jgi:hypothetical protein